ncbi:hypothetical protein BB560_006734 [Smittium megazygosporum]|uniref:SRP54-type proteins GTP-binding domain-containing protein n=1 Tax=Smittium megazygosporum TaxID=133381 RepID=A0A2T9Y278_9FUNG|nr:hypothetical protein BB560_006734 [Smittium megazygosporum]
MLDYFAIATQGGILLWSKTFVSMQANPVNPLIHHLITSPRSEEEPYIHEGYQLNWTTSNEFGLVFITVCQKILQLTYLRELLLLVKKRFIEMYKDNFENKAFVNLRPDSISFEKEFDQIYFLVENNSLIRKKATSEKPRAFEDTKKFRKTLEGTKRDIKDLTNEVKKKQSAVSSESEDAAFNVGPRRKSTQMRSWDSKKSKKNAQKSESENQKNSKNKRVWDDETASKEEIKALDFSEQVESSELESGSSDPKGTLLDEGSLGVVNKKGVYELAELVDTKNKSPSPENNQSWIGGSIGTFLKNITSGVVLTEKDLNEPISKIREHLVTKNVAADIAATISESVKKELIGAKVGGLQRVSSLIYPAMEKTLTRVLTPSTSTDLLSDIHRVKSTLHRPYSIAFVGVNGVGKSTNLSKVCFWLLQNNFRVLIAACDTFRSGAVEQLGVHVKNLRALSPKKANVDVFERGYGKDSAAIAKEAVSYAESNGYDVVLIDTAGRMQNNEPLMRALAKLVYVNNPDKILFVGEALVGNEAVQQLTKFNQALVDFSPQNTGRTIDGIILSKFDTIDDKVGAALTMTYVIGKPILFVGTGQTYTDLKTVKISSVVDSLLKD